MGGGQTTMENSRPPLDKVAKGRGRGLRPDSKRPTVLHTQSLDDMDDISLLGLTMARMDAFHTHTARLCQERCESSYTVLDSGPPPLAADQDRLPEVRLKASEDQPNQVSSTLQGALDHHHTTEVPWNPIGTEPLSGTRLEPAGETTPGPSTGYPDQFNRVPSTPQGALPLLEPKATIDSPSSMYGFLGLELAKVVGNTSPVPLEASMEPPTQPEGEGTTTPIDNHDWGSPEREGHIADGSDKGRLKKDPINSKPICRTDPLPDAGFNSPTTILDLKVWPLLPRLGAQDQHGPTLQSFALSRASPADSPTAPPMDTQQAQTQPETDHSTEQATSSSEGIGLANGVPQPITSDAETNAPKAGQSMPASPTLTGRKRSARRNRPAVSSTACFSFDTSILVVSQGYACWKMIHKVTRGELVVQSLPSGHIMDLSGALTTPVKTLCYFDTKEGGNDMVYLGTSTITPNHHIHMAEGWMTASQAVDDGQGTIRRSILARVFNLCLEGRGQYSHQHLTPAGSNDIHTGSNDGLPLSTGIGLPTVQCPFIPRRYPNSAGFKTGLELWARTLPGRGGGDSS